MGRGPQISAQAIIRTKPRFCLCDDEKLSDPEKYFEINVFYGFLDVDALSHRFKGLRRVTLKIGNIVFPTNLLAAVDEDVYNGAVTLFSRYAERCF